MYRATLPEMADPLTSNTVVDAGAGSVHTIELPLVCSPMMQEKPVSGINMASGYVVVRNKINGVMQTIDIVNAYNLKLFKPQVSAPVQAVD